MSETRENEKSIYNKLNGMSLMGLKGFARRIHLSNLLDLTDEETAMDEIMGFLFGEEWEITLMNQGVI